METVQTATQEPEERATAAAASRTVAARAEANPAPRGLKILASPARRNRAANPFNFLLSEALAAQGCEVADLRRDENFRGGMVPRLRSRLDPFRIGGGWDVFHIHWPQNVAKGSLPRALANCLLLTARLLVQRLRGARIVWTVHNVRDHDQRHVALERGLMWCVARLVHGVIFLTASSRTAAYREMPTLASKPFAVIPHGLYGDRSTKTSSEARSLFGLSPDKAVIGFLGDIRRYKGLDLLLAALEQIPPAQVTLFIAGALRGPEYGAAVRSRLSSLGAKGYAIVFREERLDNAALVDAIRACDIVALPYRAVWNSGLALLILENHGRILASDAPVFEELQGELGDEWVQTFDGNLTGERVLSALGRSTAANPERIEAFSAARSWSRIGAETVAFYRRLGAR